MKRKRKRKKRNVLTTEGPPHSHFPLGRDEDKSTTAQPPRPSIFFLFFGAHKLQSFGLAGTATKRAKRGYKATTASNWVKVKPLRAKSAAQIKTRRAPNADSNGR
ncbi:BZ3500_MvSof-1268-A1-R1_Chr3-1g05542 [Microbotryum saponariae]|uniref:BZ3500_MvSof-1268-A1-R1_Chr3-1g05542 protein n=1 Tax=Microbotryum saponariae TaxID=289078 RepID=A0A2X0LZ30_9BASI|nr:BZ3500_MvSof-1268-A1-R1_Chr3-1g05542 [Microbotryum saponariae]SDA04733.1 BZ3501_MvSof-1269-A2-R1_Chr3-1g05213 [Microbotryum saponariae]